MSSENGPDFYQHSGSLGNAFTTILLLGTPVAVLMAAVYSYLVVYVPLIGYVNVLFLGGYVVGTGYVLGLLAKFGKCRNAKALFLLGCVVGSIGLYAAWIFFFQALVGEDFPLLDFATHPQAAWAIVKDLNAEGWWEGGPTGVFGWVISGIEAAAFILGCGVMTSMSIDREVFCEQCNSWCSPTAVQNLKITEEFAESLDVDEEEDWKHFDILKLPAAEANEYPRFVGEVLSCTGCGETSAIRLKLLSQKQGDNGLEEESKDIEGILLLANSDVS